MSKFFSPKETLKNDFKNCAKLSPMSGTPLPPRGGHKNKFLKTPLDSIFPANLPPSLLMVSAGLANFQSFLNRREHGNIAESADMGL